VGTHEHDHQHGHHHHHDDGFDWEAMADRLELDAAIVEPITRQVVGALPGPFRHVLDVGCGPGAVAVTLAELAPDATVTALDSSAALLQRVRVEAERRGIAHRVHAMEGDLEHDLPELPAVDLVWAGMVLHHVGQPVATLQRLHRQLLPGGTLAMMEFGRTPTVLPDHDPVVVSGAWARFQAATTASLNERLGLDPVAVDWPALLAVAGFIDVVDRDLEAVHPGQPTATVRAWLVPHLARGVEMAGDRLDPSDAAAILELATQVPHRDDLTVVARRRIVTARRPAG
jgi:SAM-dependent methyltransferase